MGILSNNPYLALGNPGTGYQIQQSLRFNSADSANLSRTPGSTGNRRTYTVSCWVKRAQISATQMIWSAGPASGGNIYLYFTSTDELQLSIDTEATGILKTTAKYRDPSAWYHIVCVIDTTEGTAANRIKFFVNGAAVTNFASASYPSQNHETHWNNTSGHRIGQRNDGTAFYLNGYIAEFNNLDGTAVTDALDFGEYDNFGVWRPKRYTGSYSGNSFYLKFDAADVDGDSSGLGNDWTANNITTSGTGTDVMSDTPTTNWCTLNPLVKNSNLSDGNLVYNTATAETAYSTFGVSSGKWYCEVTCNNANTWFGIGTDPFLRLNSAASNQVLVGTGGGTVYSQNSTNTFDAGDTWTTNDVIGIALDADNGGCIFYKNNTRILEWDSFTVDGPYFFGFDRENPTPTTTHPVNFGQRDFAYTPPTGFKALNTANLPAPTIKDGSKYFDTLTYTGPISSTAAAGTTGAVTGLASGFTPDLVWIKCRNQANWHQLFDQVRGVDANGAGALHSNEPDNEVTTNLNGGLSAFNDGGFTVIAGSDTGGRSNNTGSDDRTYAAWCWKAGGIVSADNNTDGSITSTVSANPSAGFSIVSYTGTGVNATVGHGLGVAPKMIIAKDRDADIVWAVHHSDISINNYLRLNTDDNEVAGNAVWNQTAPTSTVFSIGTSTIINNTNDYIAYCFAEVEGFSRIGSFVGNQNANGPFIFCGFRPAYVWLKGSTFLSNWNIYDSARDQSNITDDLLRLNSPAAEVPDYGATAGIDLLSNGFKIRTAALDWNTSGATFVFCAFAENPFGGFRTTPVTAR